MITPVLQQKSRSDIYEFACVHGRFQPFHNEHLEYVSRAYELCRTLYIGITHALPGSDRPVDSAPHRHTSDANPFTFADRMEMILQALTDVGYDVRHVRIVPFPIETPSLIRNYVPANAVHLLSPCDEWQIEKYCSLSIMGLQVEWLFGTRKGITATEVRSRLRRGLSISGLVPPPVERYLSRALLTVP